LSWVLRVPGDASVQLTDAELDAVVLLGEFVAVAQQEVATPHVHSTAGSCDPTRSHRLRAAGRQPCRTPGSRRPPADNHVRDHTHTHCWFTSTTCRQPRPRPHTHTLLVHLDHLQTTTSATTHTHTAGSPRPPADNHVRHHTPNIFVSSVIFL